MKYFNEFTKPAGDENIRQRYKTEGEILADKFCNWYLFIDIDS